MMSSTETDAIAESLFAAYRAGRMVDPPSALPGFDLDAAYAVEARLKQFREAEGHKAVGRKVGYANKAMLRALKLETLLWAHMYDDTVHYAQNNSASLALANVRSLKIEPEIVFALKQPLAAPAIDAYAALAAAEWIALGFEIIDCPYPEWKFQPVDFLASFGLHAALVVGEKINVSLDSIPDLVVALPDFKLRVLKNGELVEEGSGKNSLRSPALCLAELGAAIGRRFPEEALGAGELVSSGTLTSGHLAAKGDLWTAHVEGVSLPALTLRLA
jgi:2-keto-4-pentenoate hydratase